MARNGYHGDLGRDQLRPCGRDHLGGIHLLSWLDGDFFRLGSRISRMALSSLYIGFSPTFVGTIAGAVWGLRRRFRGRGRDRLAVQQVSAAARGTYGAAASPRPGAGATT